MFRRVHGARAWVLGVGGFLGVLGAIATYVGIVTQALPHAWQPYAILITMSGFAAALWATGTSNTPVDGVLYRENILNRNRISELEKQLEDARPREITQAQRAAIATRLEATPEYHAGWEIREKHFRYRPRILIGALVNAPDSLHLAEALEEVLQFRFDVEWADKGCLTYYSMDDVEGIVLLEGREQWWLRDEALQENLKKYARYLADSFAAEGIRIDLLPPSRFRDLKYMTLLVGRKP